jgi:hypothetical protein
MARTPTPQNPDDSRTAARPDEVTQPHPHSGTPRWVKAFAVAGIVAVVLVIVMLFTGHGPGRHPTGPDRAAGPAAVLGHPYDLPGPRS